MERFDKGKLRRSVRKAGAKEAHAVIVANKIAAKVKEGTKTEQIWRWVVVELRLLDRKAAETYRTYRTRMSRTVKRLTR
jgi:2-phosphoglycerate kinase